MFDFQKPKIEIAEISEDKKYGRFVVEPLERGYGTTLGNSLRRIMLSSLPGVAVSQVKIEGVLHEFSSIPGVKEDVTEIVMNIKELAIRNNSSSDEPKVAYIDFEGEGVVTAADIQADSDIQILNPDLVIANLNGGADSKLYMELTITKGRGYVSSDNNKTEDIPIGVIAVDSIYTPVERVNLLVENTRVGQVTDYDKLTLDVFTNGTLEPDEAVSLAAKVLSEHLSLFIDLSEAAQTADIMIEKEDNAKEKVLGVKVEYMKRGHHWFSLKPQKPIMIEGICQEITVWVAGRNYNHTLKVLLQDFYGNSRQLYVDRLRFVGWKELKVSIPESIIQRDFHFVDRQGIKFTGFLVECDPVETYGTYYVYFDELRALTDIFNEKTRDLDDMVDGW